MTTVDDTAASRIGRLLDAIDLAKAGRREEALPILRGLIRESKDFEEAWLWMSVVVDSIDESIVCLENVLRINPRNWQAAGALHRLRETELQVEKRRSQLRFYQDTAFILMWLLIFFLIYAVLFGGQATPSG